MTSPTIINSDMYKLHIDLSTDLNSGSLVYYILNNNVDDNINCIFDLFLSTNEIDKYVLINLEQYDNNDIKITENISLTKTNANIQKAITLYTQLLKITFISDTFNGHIYGNIKKTNVTTISTTNSISSINVNFDKMTYDAFGRLRMSQPFTLFDSLNKFSKNDKFTDISNNNAHALFNSSDSTVDLSVSNQINSYVIRETKNIFPYQPGKSLLVLNTFTFNNTDNNNLIQRVGYYSHYNNPTYTYPFNPKNGIYLDACGSVISLCKANNSNVTKILKSNWNNYTFSGEAPYFINLDLSKAHIFWIDIEWLGVGSVRTGFIINGKYILAHTFHHANIENTTYMQTACLPIRYEIINTTNGPGGLLKQICSSIISEGGYENSSFITHAGRDNSLYTVTSENSKNLTPLVSIRLKQNHFDSIVIPCEISLILDTNDNINYKLILNGTLSGTGNNTPTFRSAGLSSNVEYDISANNIVGGTVLNSSYLYQNSTISIASRNEFNLQLGKYFTNSPTNYTSDILTLATTKIGNAGAYNIAGLLGWFDIIK